MDEPRQRELGGAEASADRLGGLVHLDLEPCLCERYCTREPVRAGADYNRPPCARAGAAYLPPWGLRPRAPAVHASGEIRAGVSRDWIKCVTAQRCESRAAYATPASRNARFSFSISRAITSRWIWFVPS